MPLLPPSPDSRRRFAMARQVGAARTEAHKFMGMFFHRDFSPADFSFCLLPSAFASRHGFAACAARRRV